MEPVAFAQVLHGWQVFYTLVGGAAATLTGLMFVAASLGVRLINERDDPLVRTFITPTVIHFSVVLLISALMTVPLQIPALLTTQLAVAGLSVVWYSLSHLQRLRDFQRSGDMDGRAWFWNLTLPLLSGFALLAGALALRKATSEALAAAAIGIGLLLIVGLHNAWTVMLYLTRRTHFEDDLNNKTPRR